TFQVQLDGPTPGPGYDQLTTSGSVTLGGALDIIAAPGLVPGTNFTILNKTSAGAITGTFTGKAQGSTWQEDGYLWQISYTGGDGNDVTVTLLPPPPFDTWVATYPTLTGNNALPTADPDNDGVQNLMEYATAMNPTANDVVPMSALKNGSTLEFIYTKNKAATDVTFTVEWSDDLMTWSTAGVTQALVPGSDNGVTQQLKATMAAGASGRRFMHLKITRP
ncbi:MAG: hypothetical protein ACOYMN_18465, partial [Roseimicrobium sp.]